MQPSTPIWPGWLGIALANAAAYRLSWSEWCAHLQGIEGVEQVSPHATPFSERELARLAFVRWLHHTGRLDPARGRTAAAQGAVGAKAGLK
jgi:hypothetical protein